MMGLGVVGVLGAVVISELVVRREPSKEGRVVVTYWEKWTNFEEAAMREVVKEFNRSQDRIYVEFLSVSGIGQKVLMATAGGIPPDVAGLFGANVAQYAFNNAVMPLDEMAAEAGISREDYIPIYWDICSYRGRLWALPSTPASTTLHFNRTMFREGGWDPERPPRTFEELDAMDKQLGVVRNGRVERMGFLPTEPGWWPWSWPGFFGGDLWNGLDRVTMSRAENVRAYTWMRGYSERYGLQQVQAFQQGFGGFDSPQNAFLDGKVASVLQGVWMFNFIERHRPDMDWTVADFPHPGDRPDLARTTVADCDVLVIPRGAKHPREAFEFIKFVQSRRAMEMLCMGQKKHSPLREVSEEFVRNHPNPYMMKFRELAMSPNALIPPRTPIWPAWSDELSVAIQRINSGSATPEEAMRAVEAKIQPLLDKTLEIERKTGLLTPEMEAAARERAATGARSREVEP